MLPEGMAETLAPSSWALEDLRRKLLDHYRAAGYELILTPLVEHLESLLTGSAEDLEQQTFKLIDPESGRLLGLRADMTPQAARVAARHYAQQDIVRLCYLGTVLRATAPEPGQSRSPRQVGCEIFGEPGLSADIEAINLMLQSLSLAGVNAVALDLGHVGVYRGVVQHLALSADDEAELFRLVQRKSGPDMAQWMSGLGLDVSIRQLLVDLLDLNGGLDVLDAATTRLSAAGDLVQDALAQLRAVCEAIQAQPSPPDIHVDLAELRGYRYKTGLVFAAFVADHGREIARGGRYDGVGAAFGEHRSATGFSADINELLRLGL
jgi:ATP phosphoribosyltransferase regulatory subunit